MYNEVMNIEFSKNENKVTLTPLVTASRLLDVVTRGYTYMTNDTDYKARVVVYGTKVGGYVRIVPSETGMRWLKSNRHGDYWPTSDDSVRYCTKMIEWGLWCDCHLNTGCNIPYQVYCKTHVGPMYIKFAVPHEIIKGY